MESILIGNDINVAWKIFSRNGVPFPLQGMITHLYLLSGPYKKEITDYTVANNVVSFIIKSDSITQYGVYKLLLSIIDKESEVADASFDVTDVFQIVHSTYNNVNNSVLDGDVHIAPVSVLNNVVSFVTPGGGQSQYIFVAYSNDNGATLTANDGVVEGKYIGYCISDTNLRPLAPSSYIWARLRGEDGLSYEYIYKVTAGATAPDIPDSNNADGYAPIGWSDTPQDVSYEYPYVWMCSRKKVEGVWSDFEGSSVNLGKAALFGKFGRDGADGADGISPNTSFKSIVFKRSNVKLDAPTGGSYEAPVPSGWSDGVPAGNEQLWMSTRIFSSDGQSPQQNSWTAPEAVSDNEYLDYEFSSAEVPGTPSKESPSAPETNNNWSNTASTDTIWMAMRKVSNGAYAPDSGWMITKIKGENGEDGTSVTIKGTKNSTSELPSSGNTTGDGYLVGGDLYVWDGDSWVNAGKIQGPAGPAGATGEPGSDGKSPYLHIKYANLVDGQYVFTSPNGETPGDYIGMYSDYISADSTDVNDYAPWRAWKGEDGFGYEYIFKLTADNTPPDVPSDINQSDDYIPEGWSDNAGDVSSDYPYCWVCYRKKTGGVWGGFIGSSINEGKAALFARYGKDGADGADGAIGRGITTVTEWYAVSSNSTTPPEKKSSAWSKTVPELSATNKYLWNYEVIKYTDNDTSETEPCVIGVFGKDGVGILKIEEFYCVSEFATGVTIESTTWQTGALLMTSEYPYLWNYERITFTDGSTQNTNPVVIGIYGVRTDDDMVYLEGVFGEDNVSGKSGALVRNLLGVTSVNDDDKIVAMMNASDIGKDATHGKLVFAAGMNGISSVQEIDAAKFKVYEDGTVKLTDVVGTNVNLSGTINATAGTIGCFDIEERSLSSQYVNQEHEFTGTLEMTAGSLFYNVQGNNYGGKAVIGYRSASDKAIATFIADQDDPALYVSCTGDSYAILVENGPLAIANGASIKLLGSTYIEAIEGFYKGFRTPIVTNATANESIRMKTNKYDNSQHTFIAVASGLTYILPSTPVAGDEFDIITLYDSATLNPNSNSVYQVYDGQTLSDQTNNIFLSAKYHYRMWWTGSVWIMARN